METHTQTLLAVRGMWNNRVNVLTTLTFKVNYPTVVTNTLYCVQLV